MPTPRALALAAPCVVVVDRGPWHHVRIVPPGTDPDHSLHWATASAADLRRHYDAALAMVAAFVDLGLARARVTLPTSDESPAAFMGLLADAPCEAFPPALSGSEVADVEAE